MEDRDNGGRIAQRCMRNLTYDKRRENQLALMHRGRHAGIYGQNRVLSVCIKSKFSNVTADHETPKCLNSELMAISRWVYMQTDHQRLGNTCGMPTDPDLTGRSGIGHG